MEETWGFFDKGKLMVKGRIYKLEYTLNSVHLEVTNGGADTHM